MIKIINYFFQSIFFYLLFLIGRILGLNISRIFFASLFSYLGPSFRSKKTIDKNLEIFSSVISKEEKKKIKTSMWRNYGMTFIEYVFLKKFRSESSHILLRGEENLNEVLNKKKPIIFISGHFANFELMSMEITKKNIKLATIYRPLNNFFLNPYMEYLRKKYVCDNQIKKGIKGVRHALEYLKKNYSIALMIDQRVSEGDEIKLFGKSSLTTTLPAQLAIKFSLNIVPVFIERSKDNKFIIEFQKSIDSHNYKDKIELSEKLNKVLEKMISKNPSQWIWTHNRWK